jgi:hypothetical protein
MKICVTTCDKYEHLMPGFAHLFNKYWGVVPVDVLGYRPPPALPANFQFVQLEGPQAAWTTGCQAYVKSLPPKSAVCWLLDDYWFYGPVYHTIVDELMHMVESGEIAKGDLSNNTKNLGAGKYHTRFNYWLANQDAQYRSSLQAAIWNREYILKLLAPGRSPWQFELDGQGTCANDKQKICAYDLTVCRYANIYYKGSVEGWQVDKLAATDLNYMYDAGICQDVLKHSNIIHRRLNP